MNSPQTETNELKDHFGGFKKLLFFFRQRRQILDNPESMLVSDPVRSANGPLAFAVIALSASYLLMVNYRRSMKALSSRRLFQRHRALAATRIAS